MPPQPDYNGGSGQISSKTQVIDVTAHPPENALQAADQLTRLAELVDKTGLSAAAVGQVLQHVFRLSPVEHSANIREGVLQMSQGMTDAASFAEGLRRQAERLRGLARGDAT